MTLLRFLVFITAGAARVPWEPAGFGEYSHVPLEPARVPWEYHQHQGIRVPALAGVGLGEPTGQD